MSGEYGIMRPCKKLGQASRGDTAMIYDVNGRYKVSGQTLLKFLKDKKPV